VLPRREGGDHGQVKFAMTAVFVTAIISSCFNDTYDRIPCNT
jgi:hypothetical protein